MTNMLPGEAPHHGMYDNGPYRISQDKPEDGGRWYFSRKEIEDDSPSRLDSIDMKKETYLRKSYCTFLQDLGMRLKVPQVTIATAIIFCHRFFHRQSHAKNDRRIIATVCMFLAGKVEETPRPLKDVILVSYEIIYKKDPSAVQRIKQKEVYDQQKELILLAERSVLATLGFDLNVHHPYKPLVEAIQKFNVPQNPLAKVAWNFVNDGLRTSLCLQFMPHHIAAGAIFLAAKFLKVKLPSDGEKVWWQEFDVTPRQLEEFSNQMLELYEQNRVPQPCQTSEVEGSADASVGRHPFSKVPTGNEEHGPNYNSMAQSGVTNSKPGTSLLKPASSGHRSHTDNHGGHSKVPAGNEEHAPNYSSMAQSGVTNSKPGTSSKPPASSWTTPDRSHTDNHGGHSKITQKRSSNDYGGSSVEMKSVLDRKADVEVHESVVEPRRYQEEVQNRPPGEQVQERNGGRAETREEIKDKCHSYYRDGGGGGGVGQSPQEAIKKIDKDKVKAALEKRRKARGGGGDANRKTELLMDEDDLIERELEDGIQLASQTEKVKQERTNWSKPWKFPDHEKGQHSRGQDSVNLEEEEEEEDGEVATLDDAGHGYWSPKSSNRKRKAAGSPPGRPMEEGEHRTDYVHGSNHRNHHDIPDDRNRLVRLGYTERDKKRRVQENRV